MVRKKLMSSDFNSLRLCSMISWQSSCVNQCTQHLCSNDYVSITQIWPENCDSCQETETFRIRSCCTYSIINDWNWIPNRILLVPLLVLPALYDMIFYSSYKGGSSNAVQNGEQAGFSEMDKPLSVSQESRWGFVYVQAVHLFINLVMMFSLPWGHSWCEVWEYWYGFFPITSYIVYLSFLWI